MLEYTTTEDEWPGHTHPTEDEVFYVIDGSLTFGSGADEFDVDQGGLAFLPAGLEHRYRIRDEKPARLLLVTAPAPGPKSAVGWDGFIFGVEGSGEPRAAPTAPTR